MTSTSDAAAAAASLREIERLKKDFPKSFMKPAVVLKGMIDRLEFVALGHQNSRRGVEAFLLREGGFKSSPTALTHILMAQEFGGRSDLDRVDAMGWSKASAIVRLDPSFYDEGLIFAETTSHKGALAWAAERKDVGRVPPLLLPNAEATSPRLPFTEAAQPVVADATPASASVPCSEPDPGAADWIREMVSRRVNEMLDDMDGAGTPEEILEEFERMRAAAVLAGFDFAAILASKGTKSERQTMARIVGEDPWAAAA